MPRYELSEGTSNKFWHIELTDTSFTTSYGRIGTNGQSSTKTFDSAAKAKVEHDKLVAEKVKKGYQLVGGAAVPPPPPAPPAKAKAAGPAPAAPAPIASPSVQPAETAGPTLEWTAELAKAATKAGAAFEVQPRTKGNAGEVFAAVRSDFARLVQPHLQNALARPIEYAELQKRVIRAYSDETIAPTLDHELEAAAFLLVDRWITASIVDLWVAHSGLAFALEAFVASLQPVGIKQWVPDGLSLVNDANRTIGDHWGEGRTDLALRAHLLGATADERALARAKALELRQRGNLVARSAMASIFLEPDWIDADLEERVRTGERAIFTELALQHAGNASALGAYFAAMTDAETQYVALLYKKHYDPKSGSVVIAERHRDAAVVPLASWLGRATSVWDIGDWEKRFQLSIINELVKTLRHAEGSPAVIEAVAAVLVKCGGEKLAKDDDPRPAALECLRRSPALALPVVREATRQKNGAWARDLAPQLERLSTAATIVEAATAEVPRVLQSTTPFKAPSFWLAEAFTRPQTLAKTAVPLSALNALGNILATGDREALGALKEACDADSLAAFAWDLFQAWLTSGAPAKEKWAFLALGLLGNDDSARKLTPLIRAWPGESAHQRAVLGLDVLAEIGSDVALMMLNGIAQKVKFKGLQERAREKMDEIAKKRGLSSEELADRLVPDLDLEDDGSKTLDFGPRSFRVGFDETLSPYVMDATGARLKELPKPNSKDEAELAAAAVEAWKAMKKDARTLSSLEILRLELAMGSERRWAPQEFDAFLVHHPLLIHLVRRLVWGAFTRDGKLAHTFRVAEDRSYADTSDEPFTVPDDVVVGLPHRLVLSDDDVNAWSSVFRDYELLQPFEQLSRQVFVLSSDDKAGTELKRFEKRVVETKKVLGLQSRGWRRGSAHDNGTIPYFYKPLGNDLNAGIQLAYGINAGGMEYTEPEQELGIVDFGTGEPDWGRARSNAVDLSTVRDVVLSEVIRDLESLGEAKNSE